MKPSPGASVFQVHAERQRRLQDYIERHNRDAEHPLCAEVVRCAVLLMRADRVGHVAVPTAVAQAQSLTQTQVAGPILNNLLGALLALEALPLEQFGVTRSNLQKALLGISDELAGLAQRLDPGTGVQRVP